MKKILYLSHRIPYPPNKGDKIRSFNEIKYLSKKYDVDLITLADDPKDLKYKKKLKKYCRQVKVFPLNTTKAKIQGFISLLTGKSITQGYFYTQAFQQIFNLWTAREKYHAIVCFSSPMAEYVFKAEKEIKKTAESLIMDFCDLDSDKWNQYAQKKTFPLNILYRLEGIRLLDFEKKINQTFDRSIFVSIQEANLFRQYYPKAKNIDVISNGVDHDFFNPDFHAPPKKKEILSVSFFGAMDYYANIDGALWFAEQIWPIVKKEMPETVFFIVGSKPDQKLKNLESDPSIRVTGFVKDIREYYCNTTVCVIPLRIARGVQNKVLEAMSMAKAVVTTAPAIQGIGVCDKPFLCVKDDPNQFASKVIELLQDQQQREKIGEEARHYIKKHFNWNTSMDRLKLERINL